MNDTREENHQKKPDIKNKIVFLKFLEKNFPANKIMRWGIYFCIAVLFVYSVLLFHYSFSSIDTRDVNVVIDIPTGSSFWKSVEILDKGGLIKNRFFFYNLAVFKRARLKIRAGEYEFNTSINPWTMINKLVHGDVKNYRVVIREDLSLREIAQVLGKDKLINKDIFFDLAKDREFLESLNIGADSIEGYLFPDTYDFNRSMNTRRIMQTMVDNFRKKVTPEMIQRAKNIGLSESQFITFASMIGKESGSDFEKPFIAAVFYNRIRKGMRLQSDPTAVYDLDGFEGKVLRSHLQRKSPYNTYQIKGLPPGPIANPGLDSLKATIAPAPVNYLYFVSKNDGTHYFSNSLTDHNKAVNNYIYLKNQQKQKHENKSSSDEG